MNKQINIVIAEAQPIFREGLRKILDSVDEFRVVSEVADGQAALKAVYESEPNVAVLCIRLPKRDGLEVARTIFARSMPVEVVFLTMDKSEACFNNAMDFGVKGYVLKDTATSDVVDAVKAVNKGDFYISPKLSNFLIDRNRRQKSFKRNIPPAVTLLTRRESSILILIGQYMTSKKIAEEMCISVRTVEHHRENIASKLGLHGPHALLKYAVDHKDELT